MAKHELGICRKRTDGSRGRRMVLEIVVAWNKLDNRNVCYLLTRLHVRNKRDETQCAVANSNCVTANLRRHHNEVLSIRYEPNRSEGRHTDSEAVRHVLRLVATRYIRPCMRDLVSFYVCGGPRAGCYPLNRGDLRSQSSQFEYVQTFMNTGDKTLYAIFHSNIVLFSPIEGISWHTFLRFRPATSLAPSAN